jgi:hypothetical protein
MNIISFLLSPPSGLSLSVILIVSYVLGLLHGATPDEHTWPITFSYAIGSYSTKRGMKAGFLFSLGFTLQRALLTTLGYLGLAYFYMKYNLDGPVYIIVGFVMAIAGSYILKGRYIHIPIDVALGSKLHHTDEAKRIPLHEVHEKEVPLKMTIVHGLIAGFGFGAYATVITFILAPQVPSLIYAPLPGLMFGLGTMTMQVLFGAAFATILRLKKLTEDKIKVIARRSAGRTLYYGGIAFMLIGMLVILIPPLDSFAISTGVPVPNLNALDIGLILVLLVVGVIGIWGLLKSYREVVREALSNENTLSSPQS